MTTFGQPLYGEAQNNTAFFLDRLVQSLPAPYRPQETMDFLQRFLLPSAEDLAYVDQVFGLLDTYVYPNSAPEEWVRWMLTEWLGWTLIPDGYPLARLRRLLANLNLHYKRRYTVVGVRELLKEFGIIAEVYDQRMKVKACARQRGSAGPLHVRVVVFGYEPFFFPIRTAVKGAIGRGGLRAYTTRQIITDEFVMAIVHWSRAAGCRFVVQWATGSYRTVNNDAIPDDDEITIP